MSPFLRNTSYDMRTLITGGAGFIGSHLCTACMELGEVRVLDNLSSGDRRLLPDAGVEFIQASILDPDAVARAMVGVDWVFHLAAFISVPASMEDPLACAQANVIGLLNVLEAAEKAGVQRLVLASSAAVYGENPENPKRESAAADPRSPYAETKWAGEFYCDLYHKRGHLSTVCPRFFNVFGPRQRPDSPYAAAVPRFIERALAGQPLVIHGDGGQTRDFVAVEDVVGALVHLARNRDLHGPYNVASGTTLTVNALADAIIRISGSGSPRVHAEPRAGDVRHSAASIDRLRATGWQPRHDLDLALERSIDWYRRRTSGMAA